MTSTKLLFDQSASAELQSTSNFWTSERLDSL